MAQCNRQYVECSGSFGREFDWVEGLLDQISLPVETLCCVLEQDTLSTALSTA